MHIFWHILCKIDTDLWKLHKFALWGPLLEQITNHKTYLHIISIIIPFFCYVKRAGLYGARVHVTVLFLQGFLFEGNSQKQNIGETHREKRWRLRGPYSDKCKMGNKIMGDSFEGGNLFVFCDYVF